MPVRSEAVSAITQWFDRARGFLRQLCCSAARQRELSVRLDASRPESSFLVKTECFPGDASEEPQDVCQTAAENSDACCTAAENSEVTCDSACRIQRWSLGDPVERLLDDVSDIWAGATVVAVHAGDGDGPELYDVAYADNGSVEHEVEGQELRARKVRLDLPSEIWESVGACFFEKQDIASFEALSRNPAAAVREKASLWWSVAYHERFGRCGPRCAFERALVAEGSQAAVKAVADCVVASALGLTQMERMPWKARYQELEKLTKDNLWGECPPSPSSPGDAAYSVSGKKVSHGNSDGRLRYGDNALSGVFFDPRLGHMVREG
eukprot:gb/GFBE01016302.1/.p1 GENE.gb/GFBE01016302.1/~~gb/GFBE01016302.1/.p1  ORF type:complete len:324 (+),score=63.67 gb/GFBE01016302.1/:1-972(+)